MNIYSRLYIICITALLLPLVSTTATAQFRIGGQLVQRGEYRHGYGKLIEDSLSPSTFISQRLRLQGSYKLDHLNFYMSIQDIRTWGNTPQIKLSDGFLSVHEAWGEIKVDSSWSFKLGRQELNYDNARFLGNLDWALQGRAHDFALIKYERNSSALHFGAGYNQDGEALSGNTYLMANQYKNAIFARYEKKLSKMEISVLFWNNGLQYVAYDSTGSKITKKEVRYTQTYGIPTLKYKLSNTTFSSFAYYQTGKDIADNDVSAYDANFQISHLFKLNEINKQSLRLTAGIEIISGTDNNDTTKEKSSFSPMYGTNHAHNGYMDYFFVGGRHEKSVGLNDIYFRLRFDINANFFTSVDVHSFAANAAIYKSSKKLSGNLGNEIDFSFGFIINSAVSVQGGYSHYLSTETIEFLHKTINADKLQNWAYLMLIIRPDSDKKYIGLLQ
jgi:hypothetical protein